MRPTVRNLRSARWAGLIFGIFVVLSALAFAQSAAPASPALESSAGTEKPRPDSAREGNRDGVHPARQLAEESREAAGEDETAKFKQSASVRWVAKLTGLSLQHAYMLCVFLNFAVVFGAILWATLKFVPSLLRNRTAQIQKAMEEARAASQDANRRLSGIESRLANLSAEIGALQANTEKEWAAEEARIRAAGEEDIRKMVQTAEQEIAAAGKSARRELTAFAASLAVSIAAKQIQIDRSTDESLVRDFAAQLARDGGSRKGGQ